MHIGQATLFQASGVMYGISAVELAQRRGDGTLHALRLAVWIATLAAAGITFSFLSLAMRASRRLS